jgi:hypothetical protein
LENSFLLAIAFFYPQLAPKFRHSVCGSIISDSRSSKRPHSIISVSSSASSASSSGSGSVNNDNRTNGSGHQDSSSSNPLMANLHRSKTNQSQCSAGTPLNSALLKLMKIFVTHLNIFECRVGDTCRLVNELRRSRIFGSLSCW